MSLKVSLSLYQGLLKAVICHYLGSVAHNSCGTLSDLFNRITLDKLVEKCNSHDFLSAFGCLLAVLSNVLLLCCLFKKRVSLCNTLASLVLASLELYTETRLALDSQGSHKDLCLPASGGTVHSAGFIQLKCALCWCHTVLFLQQHEPRSW